MLTIFGVLAAFVELLTIFVTLSDNAFTITHLVLLFILWFERMATMNLL
jgi:hypothetical protein